MRAVLSYFHSAVRAGKQDSEVYIPPDTTNGFLLITILIPQLCPMDITY